MVRTLIRRSCLRNSRAAVRSNPSFLASTFSFHLGCVRSFFCIVASVIPASPQSAAETYSRLGGFSRESGLRAWFPSSVARRHEPGANDAEGLEHQPLSVGEVTFRKVIQQTVAGRRA